MRNHLSLQIPKLLASAHEEIRSRDLVLRYPRAPTLDPLPHRRLSLPLRQPSGAVHLRHGLALPEVQAKRAQVPTSQTQPAGRQDQVEVLRIQDWLPQVALQNGRWIQRRSSVSDGHPSAWRNCVKSSRISRSAMLQSAREAYGRCRGSSTLTNSHQRCTYTCSLFSTLSSASGRWWKLS